MHVMVETLCRSSETEGAEAQSVEMARKGAGDADLKELAQCDCAAATSHNQTNARARQNTAAATWCR